MNDTAPIQTKSAAYSDVDLSALYELGKMYYELGYFAPAERIFTGLIAIDKETTPALMGLGLIKLETGVVDDAITYFREALEIRHSRISAKIGLAAAFLSQDEIARARSILGQVERDVKAAPGEVTQGMLKLWRALVVRTEV